MAAEHDADIFRMLVGHLAELDAEIDARPLPGQIAHLVAEDFPGQLLGILRGGDGDDRVGMDMIDMGVAAR